MDAIGLYRALEERFTKDLSCAWDRDGIMVMRDPGREVKKALCCLDLTGEAAAYAEEGGFDVILTHHPLIFTPLKALRCDDPIAARAARLWEKGIAVFSFHTRLDAAEGGVNDVLAELFGLKDTESFLTDGQPMGRVGTLCRAVSGRTLAANAKKILDCPAVRLNLPGKKIKKLALIGGSGGSSWRTALEAGADALLTGEAGHHALLDAADAGFCVLSVGHDYSERPVVLRLVEAVREIAPEVCVERYTKISLPTL